jgi:hypothetical protein
MARPRDDEKFSNAEAARRTEAALRAAFATPHKTYEESKIGKRKTPARKSPRQRRAVEKRKPA